MRLGVWLAAIVLAAATLGARPALTQTSSAASPQQPTYTKEQIEALKQQRARAEAENALIAQAQSAMTAKNRQAAVAPLVQLIGEDPSNWQFYGALGDAELNLGNFQEAADAYRKGEAAAQNAAPDAKVKAGEARMLTNLGNAELKLKRDADAIAAYRQAAALDPNPAVAYFNLCATQYNTGDVDGAIDSCEKAISADPTKADAYFIKGALLVGESKVDAQGTLIAPPGCAEALRKYLELAPNGPHADDVRQMLAAIGGKAR